MCHHNSLTVFYNCVMITEGKCFLRNRLWNKYGAEIDFNANNVGFNFPQGSNTCVAVFFVQMVPFWSSLTTQNMLIRGYSQPQSSLGNSLGFIG